MRRTMVFAAGQRTLLKNETRCALAFIDVEAHKHRYAWYKPVSMVAMHRVETESDTCRKALPYRTAK